MVTIRQCVTDALNRQGQSQFIQYAEPIIAVLDERETAIKETLRQFAMQRGISTNEVNQVFAAAGLDDSATSMSSTQQGGQSWAPQQGGGSAQQPQFGGQQPGQQGYGTQQATPQGGQQGWQQPQQGGQGGSDQALYETVERLTREVAALRRAAEQAGVQVNV